MHCAGEDEVEPTLRTESTQDTVPRPAEIVDLRVQGMCAQARMELLGMDVEMGSLDAVSAKIDERAEYERILRAQTLIFGEDDAQVIDDDGSPKNTKELEKAPVKGKSTKPAPSNAPKRKPTKKASMPKSKKAIKKKGKSGSAAGKKQKQQTLVDPVKLQEKKEKQKQVDADM